ncbi:MAG TPA: lysine 2,3-aminomutase [Cytophagales bacterium]|nr:lysine 2,3-aminomutase [Cytophagales bacterium]
MLLKTYNLQRFRESPYFARLSSLQQAHFDLLTRVFHFKTNQYVLDHLIDWENLEDDPLYRLNFLQPAMLPQHEYELLNQMMGQGLTPQEEAAYVEQLRHRVTPELKHPKKTLPQQEGQWIRGVYRAFRTHASLFPSPMGITCHAYCSYCFRWILFDNHEAQKQATYQDPQHPIPFLRATPEVSDVLFTGADPLVLSAQKLKSYIDPVLEVDTVQNIRISSKALAWWPYRFTTDKDADDLLRLFEYIIARGRHLNFCAHFTHVRELENPVVAEAIRRIRNTGAVIRCQAPIVEGINDTAEDWSALWKAQIAHGMVPYYMFIEANHNQEHCFRIPLAKALAVFQKAQTQTTGLARTVRGPVFMLDIHRIRLDGVVEVAGQKYFSLKCLQSPYEEMEGQIRLIPYDPETKSAGDLVAMFTPESEMAIS